MAGRVADTDGLHIYGWMRNHLDLSSGELVTFAIVFRSSQSKSGIYTGGISYVADFVGCSKETARKYLHQLEAKGLIEGMDVDKNGVRHRNYQVVDNHIPKNLGYIPKNLGVDTQNSLVGVPKKFGSKEYSKKNDIKIEFIPPTPQEVADYCRSRGFKDPEGFADMFLEICNNSGWRRANGKGDPITNWKNYIVSSWEARHKFKTYPKKEPALQQIPKDKILDYLQ